MAIDHGTNQQKLNLPIIKTTYSSPRSVEDIVKAAAVFVLILFSIGIAIEYFFDGNPRQLSDQVRRWSLKAAFEDEEFAPFSSYESLIPKGSHALSLSPKELGAALYRTRGEPMSNPKRFALGAAAWKCIREDRSRCAREMSEATLGGATMTLVAGLKFLDAAGARGNADAVADAGLAIVRLQPAMLDARALARDEWQKGLEANPSASRAKALLEKSTTAWQLRLSDVFTKFLKAFGLIETQPGVTLN